MQRLLVPLLAALALAAPSPGAGDRPSRLKLVLVTLDGARTEEVFGGIDVDVAREFASERGIRLADWPLWRSLDAPTATERRIRLMPFFWGKLMRDYGSIRGNSKLGSVVRIANHQGLSWPGYAEMLTGAPHDAIITSNDDRQSPAPTLFERTRAGRALRRDQIAVFASWERFRGIVEQTPGAIWVDAGPGSARAPWPGVRSDAATFERALEFLGTRRPEVLHIALGETDEWAHEGRYDRVLEAYRRTDEELARLWETLQSDAAYRGRTCLVITTDHGRGHGAAWRHHGPGIAGTENGWLATVSPRSDKRGEWEGGSPTEMRQLPAILSALAGLPTEGSDGPSIAGATTHELRPTDSGSTRFDPPVG